MTFPDADNGRGPPGGGGTGRPPGRGGIPGGNEPGMRAAGGAPSDEMGRAATGGVGRALEIKPRDAVSLGASAAGAGAGAGAGVSSTTTTGAATSTTGAGAATGAGAGASTTGAGARGATSITGAGVSTTTGATSSSFFAATFFAGAFFAAAFLTGLGSSPSAASSFLAATFFTAAFLTALTSSGCSPRTRPSRSARRRTRSACASMMDDECPLMSMPILTHRSTASLLVRPSSLASSWTRKFLANLNSAFHFHGGAHQSHKV